MNLSTFANTTGDPLVKSRVLAVIQARMGSVRLPGKALMKIGRATLLECVIKRSKLSKRVDRVVLATTEKPEDDPLCAVGEEMGISVVRGAGEDVLARFMAVLKEYPYGAVVRITGDNPLTDPYMLDRLITHFHRGDFDYCQVKNPPYGGGTDIYKASRLSEVAKKSDKPHHREHIITFFHDHPELFETAPLLLPEAETRPDVRITIDTMEDLHRMRCVIGRLRDFPHSTMTEVIAVWDQMHLDINR